MIAIPSAVIYIRLCGMDPQTCVEGLRQGQWWYRAGNNDIDETDVVRHGVKRRDLIEGGLQSFLQKQQQPHACKRSLNISTDMGFTKMMWRRVIDVLAA